MRTRTRPVRAERPSAIRQCEVWRWIGLRDDELPTWVGLTRLGQARWQGTQIDSQNFETWLASARSRRGHLPCRLLESDSTVECWPLIAETTLHAGDMLRVLTNITGHQHRPATAASHGAQGHADR